MRIALVEKNTCIIHHDNGAALEWSVNAFDKTKFSTVEDPFKEINGYWAWLPAQRREAIWLCYVRLRDTLNNANATHALIEDLSVILADLYECMPLEEIDHWISLHSEVIYPDNILQYPNPDDKTPDGTYLKHDYHGLVVLSTALRPMVPIWGEFINMVADTGGVNYKEYLAMRLLSKTTLISSEPVNRLIRYIETRITSDTDTAAAIITELSTSEIPDWLLSMVMVRRLAIGRINASADGGSIISNIYVFVFNTLKDLDKKFGGIREKYPEERDGDEEGSYLETYRVKQTLTIGDTAVFNVYTEDVASMAQAIDPTVPLETVFECLERLPTNIVIDIQPTQLNLAQWTMQKAISPHAIPCLSKAALLRVLAVVQALHMHWGFPEIALLVTAHSRLPSMDEHTIGASARPAIALIEKLSTYYPYALTSEPNNLRKSNIAFLAIMTLTKDINTRIWTVNAPQRLINQCPSCIERSGRILLPPTLAEQLVRLVIKINELRG